MAGCTKKSKRKTQSATIYKLQRRDLSNQAKKFAKHKKEHPNDTTTLGAIPKFPPQNVVVLDREMHKHIVKSNFANVTKLFIVKRHDVTLDVTPHYDEAKSRFKACQGDGSVLIQRIGNTCTIIDQK